MSAESQLLRAIDDLKVLNNYLKLSKSSYKLSDIEELVIEDMQIDRISDAVKEKLEELTYLESLTITKCGLRKIDNLPKLDSLLRICLDHNQIEGSQLNHLSQYKKLISISLMDNNIENLEELKNLGQLPTLLQLNLFKNTVQSQTQYRLKAFDFMPKLILLDNLYQDGAEVMLDDQFRKQEERSKKNNASQDNGENKKRQVKNRAIQDDGSNNDNDDDNDSSSNLKSGKIGRKKARKMV